MKTIVVSWTDTNNGNHAFGMRIPKGESKLNIDRLVMDEIFDHIVDHYNWEDK